MAECQVKRSKGAGNEAQKSEVTVHTYEGEYEPGRPNSVPPEHYVNFNLAEGEYLVQCPYDISHRILSHRMGRHIFRCRANYRDQLKKDGREFTMAHCPWTTRHILPQIELQYHSAQCEYRGKTLDEIEAFKRYCPKKPEGYDKLEELASGDWSDEISGPELNGTYDPKVKLETWPIMYNGSAGRSKAKKREFRDKQRLHFYHIVTKEGFFKSYKSGVYETDVDDTTPGTDIDPKGTDIDTKETDVDDAQDSINLKGSSPASTLDKIEQSSEIHLQDPDQSPIAQFVQSPFQFERLSIEDTTFENPPPPSKLTP